MGGCQVQRAVALSPSERWTSASELLSALEVTLGQRTTAKPRTPQALLARTTYEAHTDPSGPLWSSSTTGSANWRGRSCHREDPHRETFCWHYVRRPASEPSRTAWTSPTTGCGQLARHIICASSGSPLLGSCHHRAYEAGSTVSRSSMAMLFGLRPPVLRNSPSTYASLSFLVRISPPTTESAIVQTSVLYARLLDTHLVC